MCHYPNIDKFNEAYELKITNILIDNKITIRSEYKIRFRRTSQALNRVRPKTNSPLYDSDELSSSQSTNPFSVLE